MIMQLQYYIVIVKQQTIMQCNIVIIPKSLMQNAPMRPEYGLLQYYIVIIGCRTIGFNGILSFTASMICSNIILQSLEYSCHE